MKKELYKITIETDSKSFADEVITIAEKHDAELTEKTRTLVARPKKAEEKDIPNSEKRFKISEEQAKSDPMLAILYTLTRDKNGTINCPAADACENFETEDCELFTLERVE